MRTAKDYAIKLVQIQSSNDIISMEELNGEVGANYAYRCSTKGELEVSKVIFMDSLEKEALETTGKKPSIAWLEQQWNVTKGGNDLIRLGYEMKAMEQIIASVKNHIVLLSYQRKGLQ